MPTFRIEQRERWDTIVTYSIEASNEEEATELTKTGTWQYDEHEVLNRDAVRVINIEETPIH